MTLALSKKNQVNWKLKLYQTRKSEIKLTKDYFEMTNKSNKN